MLNASETTTFKMPTQAVTLGELQEIYDQNSVHLMGDGYYIRRINALGVSKGPKIQIRVPAMVIPVERHTPVDFRKGFTMPRLAAFMHLKHPRTGFLFLRKLPTCECIEMRRQEWSGQVFHGELCDPADASHILIITRLRGLAKADITDEESFTHSLTVWGDIEYSYLDHTYCNRITYDVVPIGLRYPAEREPECTMEDCQLCRPEVVRIANAYLGITDTLDEFKTRKDPSDKNQLMEALRFYLLVSTLKDKIRSGWDAKHWNVTAERLESVAEHCFKTCILAISIYSTGNRQYADINIGRVVTMIVLHEIGETLIGDITPFDGITPMEKAQIEAQAVIDVTGNLSARAYIINMFTEFEAHYTDDAIFAHLCDKLEADLQAKVYQDQGYFHPLGEEGNDFLINNPVAQKIIANGAQTPFDVWYEYDKHHYQDASLFANLLDLARDNDLADLLVDYLAPHKAQS